MVNDIRPEASVLLRQIANISQKRESGVRGQESGVRNLDSSVKSSEFGVRSSDTGLRTQDSRLKAQNSGLKSGVSVVEEVFNQIYSKSGFLKDEDVVPVKREPLGTQLDVYA